MKITASAPRKPSDPSNRLDHFARVFLRMEVAPRRRLHPRVTGETPARDPNRRGEVEAAAPEFSLPRGFRGDSWRIPWVQPAALVDTPPIHPECRGVANGDAATARPRSAFRSASSLKRACRIRQAGFRRPNKVKKLEDCLKWRREAVNTPDDGCAGTHVAIQEGGGDAPEAHNVGQWPGRVSGKAAMAPPGTVASIRQECDPGRRMRPAKNPPGRGRRPRPSVHGTIKTFAPEGAAFTSPTATWALRRAAARWSPRRTSSTTGIKQ